MYPGFCLSDEFDNGRQSGQLTLNAKDLCFSAEEVKLTMPLSRLKITLGGAGQRILYFSSETEDSFSFYTSDQSILKAPGLMYNPICMEIIKKIRRKKNLIRCVIVVVALFLAVLVGPFLFEGILIKKAADQFPVEYEHKLGEALFETITEDKTFVTDQSIHDMLSIIVAPLVEASALSYPDHQFSFYIVDDSVINAFALPGGKVVIHSGLILKSESPEELAGVLAHEISHVTQRHHIRSIIKRIGIVAIYSTIFGDAGTLGSTIAGYGTSLITLKNSRSHETEADQAGWALITVAHINPSGMISMFKKLQDAHGGTELLDDLDFFSTHPAIEDRISSLQDKIKSLPVLTTFHSYEINYSAFQDKLRKSLSQKGEPN